MNLSITEQHFKTLILSHPLLFKSRWDCMSFIFLVSGNRYEFHENGELYLEFRPIQDNTELSVISRSFLVPPKVPTSIDNDLFESDQHYYLRQLASFEYKNMELSFIEKHIDLICNTDIPDFSQKLNYAVVEQLSEHSLFYKTPFNVNKAWRSVVIQYGEALKKLIQEKDHISQSVFEINNWKNESSYQLYMKIDNKLEELEPGRRQRISNNIQRIIDALTGSLS